MGGLHQLFTGPEGAREVGGGNGQPKKNTGKTGKPYEQMDDLGSPLKGDIPNKYPLYKVFFGVDY